MREINLTGANQQIVLAAPFVNYRGVSVKETTGAAVAALVIFDGTSATGKILDEINLAANESTRELYSPSKHALIGVFVQVVSGAIAGSVFFD